MIDILTIIGMLIGIGTILFGIFLRLKLSYYIDPASFFITFGATAGATLISFSLEEIKRLPRILMNAFIIKTQTPIELVGNLARYAEIARRDGILALEGVAEQLHDEFLIKGLQLAVDGTDPEQIQTMMSLELENIMARHEKAKQILLTIADYSPAFGMVGTIIGLIAMLVSAGNGGTGNAAMAQMASGFALALLTTLYGVLSAYLVFRPLAKKLELKSDEEMIIKELIIRGVMAIQSGDNPRIVRQKLIIYLPPHLRDEVLKSK